MYNIIWDTEINGILLTNDYSDISPPRPVFFEELDILGFDNFWKYPKSTEPLLWAIGRRYYYMGKLVASAKGGHVFERPKIMITRKCENLKLEPIDIQKVIDKNREALFVLENETLDFIEHIYNVYQKEGYSFAVPFSGGKDSHAVLDLVVRILPYDKFFVIFSNTTLENSYAHLPLIVQCCRSILSAFCSHLVPLL